MCGVNDFNGRLNKIHSVKSNFISVFYSLRVYKLFSIAIEYTRSGVTLEDEVFLFYDSTRNKYSGNREFYKNQLEYNYNTIIKKVLDYDSEIVLLSYMSHGTPYINDMIESVASNNNLDHIQFYNESYITDRSTYFSDDRWHPNAKSHKIIAQTLFDVLIKDGLVPISN